MIIVLILIFGIIAYFEIRSLVSKKYWRELAAYSVFYSAAFILSLLYALDVKIPSPMKGIKYIVEDVLGLKY